MDPRLSMLISFTIGILPTFGMLYIITSRYEKVIAERDTMMSFVIGLFAGIPIALGHILFAVAYGTGIMMVISAPLLALAEVLLYHIYLNRKRLRGRSDVAFLALGFTLGASATYIGFVSGQLFSAKWANMEHVMGLAIFALGSSAVRASVGLYLARGELSRKLAPAIVVATLGLALFDLLMITYLSSGFLWTFALMIALGGLVVFYLLIGDLVRVKRHVPIE